MGRYKIIIQYDGSIFNGWQFQKESKTVQGEIENALKKISGYDNRIPVHGSGRTDTGVHAQGQVAHFDMNTKLDTDKLRNAINANISNFCSVMEVCSLLTEDTLVFRCLRLFFHDRENATMASIPTRSKPETKSNPYRLKKLIVIVNLLRVG